MELLWLAIVFYTVGLAVVLYLRPAVMFNENGTWKEFGYQRDSRHTIFPVWLFIIVWAVISYVLATVVGSYMMAPATVFATATATAVTSKAHTFATKMFEESESDEDIIEMAPPKKRSVSKEPKEPTESNEPKEKEKPRPGYYVLEPGDQTKGLRKYIYYGQSPPTD
jgi:hypothetical protein